MTVKMAIEAQGHLLALTNKSAYMKQPDVTRGKVAGFSPAARLRLIRRMARVNASEAIFLTLTFPERYPDAPEAKDRLRAFWERCRRRWPRVAAIWRMEAQRRGAPHFHILLFNIPFMPIEKIRQWWEEINADLVAADPIQIDIKKLRNARRVMAYVSKYTAKLEEHQFRSYDAELFLDDGVYLHAGRLWGVHNKAHLPTRIRHFITVSGVPDELFTAVKELMRSEWRYLNEMPDRGGVVFTANADRIYYRAVRLLKENGYVS